MYRKETNSLVRADYALQLSGDNEERWKGEIDFSSSRTLAEMVVMMARSEISPFKLQRDKAPLDGKIGVKGDSIDFSAEAV